MAASLIVLGDANRLLLLRLLLERPLSVGELMAATGLGQSLVSHHLAVLARVGWLVAHRQGRRRVYVPSVVDTPLAPLAVWIRREIPLPAAELATPASRADSPVHLRESGTLEDWLL